jgi:serine/threonine protein kinase
VSASLRDRVVAALGDHYALEGEIGRGGMSVVYRARDLRLDRAVAIKVLPPDLAHDPAVRTRFAREAHTSAQLGHPHIVPIFDVGDRDGIAYLVMGFVSGGNLGALLAHQPRQPIGEARRILGEIADALAFAHSRGVIHRDIKPDNILLDGDTGRVAVTDFGIARAMEAGSRLTNTGIAVGTPAYMSPEQALGQPVDHRSDVFAMGSVLYRALTGQPAFPGKEAPRIMFDVAYRMPKRPREQAAGAPLDVDLVFALALAKDRDRRFETTAAFAQAFEAAAKGELDEQLRARGRALIEQHPWGDVRESSSRA